MTLMRGPSIIVLIALSAALATAATPAQTRNILSDNYSIMVPEKGSKQKQKVSEQKASKEKVSKEKVSKLKVSKLKVSKREQSEPRLAPKYKSPSGTEQQVRIPQSKIVNPPRASGSGSVYVPQTGQTFQNLPTPGRGIETSQDRATRCTHQAGVYGQTGSARGAYMGSCL
jgi:transglutaminase/protease-like cytokinesis protein 3